MARSGQHRGGRLDQISGLLTIIIRFENFARHSPCRRSAVAAHSSISAARCSAYAASEAECCRKDTPISSLWKVSRSRLTARPAVVFVAPRLTLSKPSPRRACPFSCAWGGRYFRWFGKFHGRTEMVATPRRGLIVSAAMAGAACGLDRSLAIAVPAKAPDPARGFFQYTIGNAAHPGCTGSSTRIAVFGWSCRPQAP
jgi:hypothetical protein